MTARVSRIVGVTAGLAIAGGVSGAAVGGLLGLALASIPNRGYAPPGLGVMIAAGALCGAVVGGLLVPTAAWTRLRAVPFNRMARGIGSAMVVGAAIAWIIQPEWVPLGALGGFAFGIRRLSR